MFGISFEEAMVVAAIAFLLLGPRRLGELAYKAGAWLTKIKQELKRIKETELTQFDDSTFYKTKTEMNKTLGEIQKSDVRRPKSDV